MAKRDWLVEQAEYLLSGVDKGLPARAAGLTVREFLASGPRLAEFWTPVIALEDSAVRHNISVMADWCSAKGFSLAPHGKTTMAPALWQRQLDAGAWGITLATVGQIRTARDFGFESLLLANSATDPRGLRYLAEQLHDPGFRFSCWADSIATIEAMEQALAGATLARPIDICVELGAPGGRSGARSIGEARAVAERLHGSSVLRLAGVSGYEGALAHDRSEASLRAVRDYLSSMLELHVSLQDLYDDGEVILTAGGSAFFDLVAEVFDPVRQAVPRTRYVLRAGAYVTHDDGFYRGISPLDRSRDAALAAENSLRPAMRAYSRIVSHPEPSLALLDAGKRDLPYDEGLPEPLSIARDLGAEPTPLNGSSISAMNDQHGFLRTPGGVPLDPGSVVTLGISHPCTTFDKWRLIPMIASDADDLVVDLVRTYF
ncbi:amino acid deaminase [Leifsonia bigeumensis]|uniref:Amino acid deaminase n=1 Tax=Leifsonella bigeumensis TaxID=433643 RepID=A0ABP7FBP4_9MICO